MIVIVNYGLGNVQAFVNIYKGENIGVSIATSPDQLLAANKIILPGVGAFDWAMTRLNRSGMREALDKLVVVEKVPILGICVGMQMMALRSDEGALAGLGWINAEVRKFEQISFNQEAHLPHMGWNDVVASKSEALFGGMEAGARFYFLHSYYFSSKLSKEVIGETEYNGFRFASAVHSENVFGVQFHPEKSHQWGTQLLKNFAEF